LVERCDERLNPPSTPASTYTQTLDDHGVSASVGSVADGLDNVLAESFVDWYKTELIDDRVWRTRPQLELATVEHIGWFNYERLHESLGDIPPAEYEQRWHASLPPAGRIRTTNQSRPSLRAAAEPLTRRHPLAVEPKQPERRRSLPAGGSRGRR
jgi:putative transposase